MSTVAYTPRDPTASVLYTVVREHVETFRIGAARRDGQGLLLVQGAWLLSQLRRPTDG